MNHRNRIHTAAESAIPAMSVQATDPGWLKRAYEISVRDYSNVVASLGFAELDRHQAGLENIRNASHKPDLFSLIGVKLEALEHVRIRWLLVGKVGSRTTALPRSPRPRRAGSIKPEGMERIHWLKQELDGGIPSIAALEALWNMGNASVDGRAMNSEVQWNTVLKTVDRALLSGKVPRGITRPVNVQSLLTDVREVLSPESGTGA